MKQEFEKEVKDTKRSKHCEKRISQCTFDTKDRQSLLLPPPLLYQIGSIARPSFWRTSLRDSVCGRWSTESKSCHHGLQVNRSVPARSKQNRRGYFVHLSALRLPSYLSVLLLSSLMLPLFGEMLPEKLYDAAYGVSKIDEEEQKDCRLMVPCFRSFPSAFVSLCSLVFSAMLDASPLVILLISDADDQPKHLATPFEQDKKKKTKHKKTSKKMKKLM